MPAPMPRSRSSRPGKPQRRRSAQSSKMCSQSRSVRSSACAGAGKGRQRCREADRAGQEATEEKVRAELEGQRSKHERALEATIEGLQKDNAKLLRKVEKVNAPERGQINEEDIAEQLEHAFPDDEIKLTGSKGGDISRRCVTHRQGAGDGRGDPLRVQGPRSGAIVSSARSRLRPEAAYALPAPCQPRHAGHEADVCVRDDVVITDPEHVRHLARILRQLVLETHRARLRVRTAIRRLASCTSTSEARSFVVSSTS